MLMITIPGAEFFNDATQEFITTKDTVLQLEHSLISVSKWEQKWNKAFLSKRNKTVEETIDYIRCMTINSNVDPFVYASITKKNIDDIFAYVNAPMTAVYFPEDEQKGFSHDTPTSELIYYWMISLGIPFECQKWHLNRLLALIRVCDIKNRAIKDGDKNRKTKPSRYKDRRALNERRLRQYNTKG